MRWDSRARLQRRDHRQSARESESECTCRGRSVCDDRSYFTGLVEPRFAIRIHTTTMRITLSPELMASLRALRDSGRWDDDVTSTHDAFLLSGGLGAARYVTADGRFLVDGSYWDETPLRECTDDEATMALVVGAKRTGISGLLQFLPATPQSAMACPVCNGSRWHPAYSIVCIHCAARGWVS